MLPQLDSLFFLYISKDYFELFIYEGCNRQRLMIPISNYNGLRWSYKMFPT